MSRLSILFVVCLLKGIRSLVLVLSEHDVLIITEHFREALAGSQVKHLALRLAGVACSLLLCSVYLGLHCHQRLDNNLTNNNQWHSFY